MWDRRIKRINELLLREISQLVLAQQDPEIGFVTFTGVDTAEDLTHAKVFYSVLGTDDEKERTRNALERLKFELRRSMRRLESLKRIPDLIFTYDMTPQRAARVTEILASLKEEERKTLQRSPLRTLSPMAEAAVLSLKNRDRIIRQILKVLKSNHTFFLSGHAKPDGDTVGSELAFASFLRRQGGEVDIFNEEPLPAYLRFLPGAGEIKAAKHVSKHYDVAIVFECTGAERMGNILDLKKQVKLVINIDHHAHHKHYGHLNLIDPSASSNAEQLFYFFSASGLTLTREEAICLYVGLLTDTGRFQQNNTNVRSHEVAAALLKTGIPVAEISRRIYGMKSPAALRLLGRTLENLRLGTDGKVVFLTISRDDFSATGACVADVEEIINYGLMIPSVEVAVLLSEGEMSPDVRVSLRGKGKLDLCGLAVSLGGGGHRNAAGFTLPGTLKDVGRQVDRVINLAMRETG